MKIKKILNLAAILLVCNISSAQTLNWSATQTISSGSQNGYGRPRVVTTANNKFPASPLFLHIFHPNIFQWNGL